MLCVSLFVCVQLAQLQAELEAEWKGKCEQALASAKEQQARVLADLAEQKDALENRLAQVQEKVRTFSLNTQHASNQRPVNQTAQWIHGVKCVSPSIKVQEVNAPYQIVHTHSYSKHVRQSRRSI